MNNGITGKFSDFEHFENALKTLVTKRFKCLLLMTVSSLALWIKREQRNCWTN